MISTQYSRRLGLPLLFLIYDSLLLLFAWNVRSAPATKPNSPQQQTPHCLHRGDLPIAAAPSAADCTKLAQTFRAALDSDKPRVWGLQTKEWPIPVVLLPAQKANGTCKITIDVEGSPYYDIAKYNDFATVIEDTVRFCLDSPYEVGIGGVAQSGANGWLKVYVTGKRATEGIDGIDPESGGLTINAGLGETTAGAPILGPKTIGTPETVKQPDLTSRTWTA